MKKLITSAFFVFAVMSAQAANDSDLIKNQAAEITRRLANEIGLNESEFIQVKKYTTDKLAAVAEIKEMYSNDSEMMFRKIAEIEASYNHSVQSILTAKQFDNYVAYNKNLKTDLLLIAENQE
jgi:hypothetical protein